MSDKTLTSPGLLGLHVRAGRPTETDILRMWKRLYADKRVTRGAPTNETLRKYLFGHYENRVIRRQKQVAESFKALEEVLKTIEKELPPQLREFSRSLEFPTFEPVVR